MKSRCWTSIRMVLPILLVSLLLWVAPAFSQSIRAPEQFFGFPIGTDGELARYPKVVEYLQYLAEQSDRVSFEEVGKTTMGNPYVLVTRSAPENLARLDRLVEINPRLAYPRGRAEEEAYPVARGGVPCYLLVATRPST